MNVACQVIPEPREKWDPQGSKDLLEQSENQVKMD